MMPSLRGVFAMIVLLAVALVTPAAHADVVVEGIGYGKTVIVELVNESDSKITQLQMWLDGDRFESCDAENGWTCAIAPESLIVFDSSEPLLPDRSARLALVTDKPATAIFWKALDGEENIETGTMLPDRSPVQKKPDLVNIRDPNNPDAQVPQGPAITDESIFRLVPEKLNVGSTVRVVGQMLGASQPFDFYIGSEKIGTFRTDKDGSFVGTAKISESQNSGRVEFRLSSAEDHREISLRIGDARVRTPPSSDTELTLNNAPDIVHRGDQVNISGTGNPNSAITAEITAPSGGIINSMIAEIDSKGIWGVGEPVTIPADAQFGIYTATITDGRQTITKQWRVESNQVIDIKPIRLKFNPGEDMVFEGTASPDAQIVVTMENPGGKEISSDVVKTGSTGFVSFKFPTAKTMAFGTYTLIASLGSDREFIYAGLGQLPSTQVNLELDRFHYDSDAIATILFSGSSSDTLELLIVDDSNNKEVVNESITLRPDGSSTYALDLKGFKSTVYSAVIKKGNIQSEEKFAVNLKTNPSNLVIHTTKTKYLPGEAILITGNTMEIKRTPSDSKAKPRPPVCPDETPIYLVTISLVDPDGTYTRQKSSFANNKCQISDQTFRVPTDAKAGTWAVRADSGSKYATTEFEVVDTRKTGIQIAVEKGEIISGQQESVDIHVTGSQSIVTITITSWDDNIIDTIQFPANNDGEVNQPWLVPIDIEPGTYTFRASYSKENVAEATYEITG
ncbi:MAG: biofilm-associated protein [Nitrosopumilus sp. B06]|nr:MAG: biofilm-associated protein [Nitrosopumilus sp. D6]RNJ79719.1 MAG: biofilm-associated protein [Nitrosopumilus sp. B06]